MLNLTKVCIILYNKWSEKYYGKKFRNPFYAFLTGVLLVVLFSMTANAREGWSYTEIRLKVADNKAYIKDKEETWLLHRLTLMVLFMYH